MDLWNYFGPSATALWNMRDARAGEYTEAMEYDSDEYDATEYDSDESATAHPLGDNLSPYLRPKSPGKSPRLGLSPVFGWSPRRMPVPFLFRGSSHSRIFLNPKSLHVAVSLKSPSRVS